MTHQDLFTSNGTLDKYNKVCYNRIIEREGSGMENKMFMCEMTGCFDSATHDIEFTNEDEEYQICESCLEFWKLEAPLDLKSVKEFANRTAS